VSTFMDLIPFVFIYRVLTISYTDIRISTLLQKTFLEVGETTFIKAGAVSATACRS
jgi:hypothetical protein